MVEVVLFYLRVLFPPSKSTRRLMTPGARKGMLLLTKMERRMVCTFRVKGSLGANWADYFPGLSMETLPEAATLLSGRVADQPAFIGILNQIHNFGLVLLYVHCTADEMNDHVAAPVEWDKHANT